MVAPNACFDLLIPRQKCAHKTKELLKSGCIALLEIQTVRNSIGFVYTIVPYESYALASEAFAELSKLLCKQQRANVKYIPPFADIRLDQVIRFQQAENTMPIRWNGLPHQ